MESGRFLYPLVVMLLVVPACLGYEIGNPRTVTEARFLVSYSGSILAPPGSATLVVINESIPMNYSSPYLYQVVHSRSTYPVVTDEHGNPYAMITLVNPSGLVKYEHSYTVETRTRPITSLPSSYSIPPEYEKYLLPAEGIESDNPDIRELARRIASNATTDFEKLALLTRWVHENVEYDESLAGAHKPASWVLEHKRGVCAEHATLLAAMLRSIGIPARYVSSYAYGDDGMEAHAFVEAYLGKWIPADPTWLEVGTIDATHFVTALLPGNTLPNPMIAQGENPGLVEWTRNKEVVSPLYSRNDSFFSSFSILSPGRVLAPGDYFVLATRVNTTSYTVMDLEMVPCRGAEDYIQNVTSSPGFLVLEPGRERVYYSLYRVDPSFPEGLVLSCPFRVYAQDGRSLEATISVMEDTSRAPVLTVSPSKKSTLPGEYLGVRVSVDGRVPPGTVLYCGNEHHLEKMVIDRPGDYYFFLDPGAPGRHGVYAFTSIGGGARASYEVAIPSGRDPIETVSAPAVVLEGEKANVSIVLRPVDGSPRATLLVDGVSRGRIDLSTGKTLVITVGPFALEEGACSSTRTITIGIETSSGVYERNITITVNKKPGGMLVDWIPLGERGVLLLGWASCPPSRVRVKGSESMATAKTTRTQGMDGYCIVVPPVETLEIEWMDSSGHWHPASVRVPLRDATIIDTIWTRLSCLLYGLGVSIEGGECYCE